MFARMMETTSSETPPYADALNSSACNCWSRTSFAEDIANWATSAATSAVTRWHGDASSHPAQRQRARERSSPATSPGARILVSFGPMHHANRSRASGGEYKLQAHPPSAMLKSTSPPPKAAATDGLSCGAVRGAGPAGIASACDCANADVYQVTHCSHR